MTTTFLAPTANPDASVYDRMFGCQPCGFFGTRSERQAHLTTPEHAATIEAQKARTLAEWDAADSTPRVPREVALSEPEKDRFSGERTDLPVRPRQAAASRVPGTGKAPSDKATAYLRTLLAERAGIAAAEAIRTILNDARTAGRLTAALVSTSIDALKEIPRNVTEPTSTTQPEGPGTMDFAALDALPAGRYFVLDTFVKVDRPKNGTYEGFVFVKRQDFGPDTDGVRIGLLNPKARTAKVDEAGRHLIDALLVDPLAHAVAYGRKTGACCICARTLTDPESIAKGIGPICEAKFR